MGFGFHRWQQASPALYRMDYLCGGCRGGEDVPERGTAPEHHLIARTTAAWHTAATRRRTRGTPPADELTTYRRHTAGWDCISYKPPLSTCLQHRRTFDSRFGLLRKTCLRVPLQRHMGQPLT